MSLERKDVRAYLDADLHQALTAICNARNTTVADFIEALVVPEIKRVVHEATVIADALRVPGKTRREPE